MANSAADVSVYIVWQNMHVHTHTLVKTEAQRETQVDGGIWNMLGEEQVTARLGLICNSPQPIKAICAALLTTPKPGNAHGPQTGPW